VIVRWFLEARNCISACNVPALDKMNTENHQEMRREVEDRKLHKTVKVHNFQAMFQGCQNLYATPKECHTQNRQRTATGYTWDTEQIIEAFWSLLPHDGAVAFTLLERSP
jgi:hypothetical protein